MVPRFVMLFSLVLILAVPCDPPFAEAAAGKRPKKGEARSAVKPVSGKRADSSATRGRTGKSRSITAARGGTKKNRSLTAAQAISSAPSARQRHLDQKRNNHAYRVRQLAIRTAFSESPERRRREQFRNVPEGDENRRRDFAMDEEYLVSQMEPAENEVLQRALALLGTRYRFGGNGTTGIDCSAFVRRVYSALNLPLPRTAREQFTVGRLLPFEELKKGDLLFFHTYADFPSHVGIYVGNDRMIHASSAGGRVMISRISTPYYRSRYIGARRISAEEHELADLVADASTKETGL